MPHDTSLTFKFLDTPITKLLLTESNINTFSHEDTQLCNTSPATASTPPPSSKPTSTDKPEPKAKKNPPSYITAMHRELVGPPMGRPREGNPIGYSRKQMYALNVLTRNSDTPSNNGSTGDNWRDGSILAAAQGGSTAGQKRGHMNMLRVNTETDDEGDAIPPLIDNATGIIVPRTLDAAPSTPVRAPRRIDTDLDEQPDLHSPAASAIRVPSVRDPPPRALQLTTTTHTLLLRMINQYNTTIQDPDDLGDISDYRQFISSSRDAKNGTPILTIFGWLDRSRSFHHSNVRADIRGASLPLMHVIYTIGRHYLDAEVTYMIPDPVWEARAFMTFDPVDTAYHKPGDEGSYVSSITNIQVYGATYANILRKQIPESIKMYYVLALIFDFMAFTAQTMRTLIGHREGTANNLAGLRDLMKDSLHQIYTDKFDRSEPHLHLFEVFQAIITEICPIPYQFADELPTPDTRAQKFTTPRTHHRYTRPPLLSPQIQYADVPSTTFQRYIPEEDIEDLVPENENLPVLQLGETQVEGVEYRLEPFLVRHHGPSPYTYPPVSSTALSQSSSFFASTSATAHAPRDTAIGSPIADTTDGYADDALRPISISSLPIRPPTPPKRKHDEISEDHSANLVIETHTLNALSNTSQVIFDSGCSITGTSNVSNLHDVTECGTLSVQGAFGPSIQPSKRGKLGPLGLDAIVIDGMGHQTLVSLSQYCQGGDSGIPHVGVFTGTDFRMFELASTLPAIKLFSEIGIETTRGTVKGGIYIEDP